MPHPPVPLHDRSGSGGRLDVHPIPRVPGLLVAAPWILILLTGCSLGQGAREPTEASVRHQIVTQKFPQAEQAARLLLSQEEDQHGAGSIEAARALDLLSECLSAAGKVQDAECLDAARRALRIKEAILAPRDPELAVSLHGLGAVQYRMGDYDSAKPLLERALAIRDRTLGPMSRESAATLLYLASLHSDTGSDRIALPLLERAIATGQRGLPETSDLLALCWNVRGSVLYRLGDYAGAISSFDRSIRITERRGAPQEAALARTLFNLGGVLLELGDVARAGDALERSLRIRRRVYGPRSALVGTTHYVLGVAREDGGDVLGARNSFEEAIEIGEEAAGPDDERLAYPLVGLARIDLEHGDSVRAMPILRRALSIREKSLGTEHPSVAPVLVLLAQSYLAAGDTAQAATALHRALRLQTAGLGPRHPETGSTLEALAGYHQRVGRPDLAMDEALRSEEIGREHLRMISLGLPEHQALAYAGVRNSGLDRALSILRRGDAGPEDRRRVWDALIRSRLIVLDEAARRLHWMSTSEDSRIVALAREWSDARRRLAVLAVQGGGIDSLDRSAYDRAHEDADDRERALAAAVSGSFLPARLPGAAEISRALPPSTALISYTRAGSHYAAFVLCPRESIPEFIPLGPASEVEASVNRWVRTVWSGVGRFEPAPEQACREAGADLRARIFDPVRPFLREARRVLIVPDGALHHVNFYALPERAGRYLIEGERVIHELTCERDLISPSTGPPESGSGALIVGGPDFDARTGSGANDPFVGPAFRRLPGSLEEANEVASMWRRFHSRPNAADRAGALVLTGSEATEHSVKKAVARKDLLHFATHAYYGGRPRPPHLPVRGVGVTASASSRPKPLPFTERPLLRSGLALAGANRPDPSLMEGEDGILTAEEIASMDLSTTSWAVLSGCETGLGSVQRTEGVVGLRRAFRIAGARTLILSLWPVEDQAARTWMRELYEARWNRGMKTAEAVREASLRVLRERRAQARSTHPWTWASFVAAGDWN